MGTLNVDTLADRAGTGPATLTAQVAAKAWANVASNGVTINASLNLSSYTDHGTGDGSLNYTSNMSDDNYVPSVKVLGNGHTGGNSSWILTGGMSTVGASAMRHQMASAGQAANITLQDYARGMSVIGDLA